MFNSGMGGGMQGGQSSFGMNRSPFKKIYKQCVKHRNQHVQLMLGDGNMFTGFIEYVDQQNVYFAIPHVHNQPASETRNSSDQQYDASPYQIYRCMFPLHAIMNITEIY